MTCTRTLGSCGMFPNSTTACCCPSRGGAPGLPRMITGGTIGVVFKACMTRCTSSRRPASWRRTAWPHGMTSPASWGWPTSTSWSRRWDLGGPAGWGGHHVTSQTRAATLCARPLVALRSSGVAMFRALGHDYGAAMIAAAGADDASDALRRPLSWALIAAAPRVGALAARRQAQTRMGRVVSVQAKPWIGPWMQSLRPALAPRDIRHWTQERTE
jgi:hypothetical protein